MNYIQKYDIQKKVTQKNATRKNDTRKNGHLYKNQSIVYAGIIT